MLSLNQLIETCLDEFTSAFGTKTDIVAYAPGRINIIGEHTDYNQGLAMPCAINRWVTVAIQTRTDTTIHIISSDFDGEMKFDWNNVYEPQELWQKYSYGCLQLFDKIVPIDKGFDILIKGNVPIGSGVSSSAALEVAIMNALNQVLGANISDLELIKMCQQVEHQYLNVKSGLLDQYASQFSKEGQFMILDFLTLTHEYYPAEINDYAWILCDTKVKRSLAGSKYSERVEETQTALSLLKELHPEIASFRDIHNNHLADLSDKNQQKRLRHYITENERVKQSVKALFDKDIVHFGTLITESHYSLKNDYEVSCKELDFLVEEALKDQNCMGSRMMGGGFGGCTINLVKKDSSTAFQQTISSAYKEKFDIETETTIYQTVNGAGIYNV